MLHNTYTIVSCDINTHTCTHTLKLVSCLIFICLGPMTLSSSVAKVDIDKGLVQPSLFSAQSTVHCQYVLMQQSSVLKQPTGLDCN